MVAQMGGADLNTTVRARGTGARVSGCAATVHSVAHVAAARREVGRPVCSTLHGREATT
jgi:hypothetical protein